MRIFPEINEASFYHFSNLKAQHPIRGSGGNFYLGLPKDIAVALVGAPGPADLPEGTLESCYNGMAVRLTPGIPKVRSPMITVLTGKPEYEDKMEPVDVSDDPDAVCDDYHYEDGIGYGCVSIPKPKVPPFMNFTGLEPYGFVHKIDMTFIPYSDAHYLADSETFKEWQPVYRYKEGYGG